MKVSGKIVDGLVILFIIAIVFLVIFGIYKLATMAGIKPASKNHGEQCGLNIECKSNKCLFAKCL